MYSPTMRLLAVLELLETFRSMSGTELARRLEVDVRTVRRYITTLQDMGIPVAAERGPHGAYRLQRGRKLPPVMFTPSEAAVVSLGLRAMRALDFPVDGATLEGAAAKTERLLPEKLLHHVTSMHEAVVMNGPSDLERAEVRSEFLTTLTGAVRESRSVDLRYRSREGEATERRIDPYGVVWSEGLWYVAGYCHLRLDIRTFRLDRIEAAASTEYRFERPDRFDALEYVLHAVETARGVYDIEVVLGTTIDHARALLGTEFERFEVTEEGVVVRHSAIYLDWIAFMLLETEVPITIRKPAALWELLQRIAARAARIETAVEREAGTAAIRFERTG